jgi:hypothetical protein
MQGSMFSWQKAMDTLPAQPSPAEAIQKEQYKTNLMNVIKAQHEWEQKAKDGPSVLVMKDGNTMPWDVAAEMMPDLIAKGPAGYRSSAWVVHEARRVSAMCVIYLIVVFVSHGLLKDWNEGLGIIDKMIIRGQNMQAFTGVSTEIRFRRAARDGSDLSHSGYRAFEQRRHDRRTCFQLEKREVYRAIQPTEFVDFNFDFNHPCTCIRTQHGLLVMCEANTYKSWTSGEAAEVIREAPARLAREGWHTLRGALSLTVRYIHTSFSMVISILTPLLMPQCECFEGTHTGWGDEGLRQGRTPPVRGSQDLRMGREKVGQCGFRRQRRHISPLIHRWPQEHASRNI